MWHETIRLRWRLFVLILVCASVLIAWDGPVRAAVTAPVTQAAGLTREGVLSAKILTEERIDVVSECARVVGPLYFLNPDGKGYTLLAMFMNKGIADTTEVVSVDTMTGEAKLSEVPAGYSTLASFGRGKRTPGDKHFWFFPGMSGARGKPRGALWYYDHSQGKLFNCGSPPEDLFGRGFYRVAGDAEGCVYGTTTKKGRIGLFSYNPETSKFRSFGLISPVFDRGGETHAYSLKISGGYAYAACGKVPWRLVAVNLKTGKSEQILEAPAGNRQMSVLDGGYAIRRPDVDTPSKNVELYQLVEGKAVLMGKGLTYAELVAMLNKHRKQGPKKSGIPKPEIWKGKLKPAPDGSSELWYRLPGAEDWQKVDLKVTTYPRSIRRLSLLPDGRLLGTPGNAEGNFMYDPKTGKSEWLGRIRVSHYATVLHDGKVYMSGYANSPVFEYDPAKPWTANVAEFGKPILREDSAESNPRLVAQLFASHCHKMWDAALASDGKIFFCGEAIREGNGGGLGWWDPKEKKAGGLGVKPFAGYKTLYMFPAENGSKLVLNSHVTLNNLTGKVSETAKTFVYDVVAGKVIDDFEPVKGATMLGPIVEVSPGIVFSVASGGAYSAEDREDTLYALDLKTQEVLFRKKLPVRFCCYQVGQRGGQEFVLGPDGHVWTYLGDGPAPEYITIVRIHPKTGDIKIVGRVERRGPMAFIGKDLYRGCEHRAGRLKLRKLANIVP